MKRNQSAGGDEKRTRIEPKAKPEEETEKASIEMERAHDEGYTQDLEEGSPQPRRRAPRAPTPFPQLGQPGTPRSDQELEDLLGSLSVSPRAPTNTPVGTPTGSPKGGAISAARKKPGPG